MTFAWSRWKPVLREWLLLLAGLSFLSVAAVQGGWLYRIDQTLYDQALALWARPADRDIVIVGADEASLRALGRWPWRRAIHATLLDRLTEAGARAVIFDIILTEPDNRDPGGDAALARSLRVNARTVLPVAYQVSDGAPVGDAPPASDFAAAATGLGHVHAHLDADGMLRRAFLYGGYGSPHYPLLSFAGLALADPAHVAALQVRHPLPAGDAPSRAWVIEDPYLIPYAGPPGHLPVVSYVDVLRKDVPSAALRDRIVLVGITATGMGDEFPTPVSGFSRAMSGVEIHANVLQALREGVELRVASATETSSILVMCLTALLLAFLALSPRAALMLSMAVCVAAMLSSALLFRGAQFWISPSVLVLATMIAYPLWSWRRLESAQRYLDAELARLEHEPSLLPVSPVVAPSIATRVPGSLEQRIAAVESAGRRLRELNRFIADSLESLPEAALVTDADGVVRLANSSATRLFARLAADAVPLAGKDIFGLLALLQAPAEGDWRDLWQRAGVDLPVVSVEARTGDDAEYLLQIAPSLSQGGVRAGTIVTLSDISPLRESERRRDEALRFLSHDMRSPQASILTLLEMQETAPELMPTKTLLERIGKYARRTLTLADDFLRLARAERVRPQDFQPVDLKELLHDAADEASALASGKQIRIEATSSEPESLVNGDRDLLTRAILNLLSNAVKYSPPGTVIRCRLTRDSLHWRIDIADQGYGIAAEDLSRLFTRFTRLQAEGQPEVDGIGLGLVFVKTVVERHGGAISVQSRVATANDAERGTTFTVLLPAPA
ncbi:MAG: CHASE2 domain-containing protein [Betaproteobacteria bacterium]|nr:CHASE2 domain-containing protein [Betaproteobacteria bacterium]